MSGDDDAFRKLRHDLANPLGAMLTEVQLLLMDEHNPEVTQALRQVEALAKQMRDILAATRQST